MASIYQNGTYAVTYTDTGTSITAHVAVTRPTLRTVTSGAGATNAGMWARFYINTSGTVLGTPYIWGLDTTYAPTGSSYLIANLFPATHTFDITGLAYETAYYFGVDGLQYWYTNEQWNGTYSGDVALKYQTYNYPDVYYWREQTAFNTPAAATEGGTEEPTTTPTSTLVPGEEIANPIDRVVFAQEDGPRTFFVRTLKDNNDPPRFVDERDRKVYPLTTPATPAINSIAATQVSTYLIDNLEATAGTATLATRTGYTAKAFQVHDTGLNSHGFMNDDVTGFWARVNTDSDSSSADGFWRDVVVSDAGAVLDAGDGKYYIDLSAARYLTVDVYPYEGSGEGCVDFVMSTTATGATMPTETVIPVNIGTNKTLNECKIDLSAVSSAYRSKVKSWGFRFSSKQCTVSFHNLRSQTGLAGKLMIKVVDFQVLGSIVDDLGVTGYWVPSIESEEAEIQAGDTGSSITFTVSAAPTGVTKAKVYAYVEGVTEQYHYVCTENRTAGATSSITIPPSGTTLDDIVGNPTLQEGRCAIPQGATCCGFHHRRLVLYKKGTLYFSGEGDYTYYSRMTPLEALDNAFILSDSDPFNIPVGKYGPVYGITPLGLATGSQYILGTLVMTGGGWDLLITGDSINDIAIADKRPGGVCSYYAWTRNKDRQIVKVDVEGDVRLYGQQLDSPALSEPLRDVLRALPNKSEWWLGFDATHAQYVLGCEVSPIPATASVSLTSNVVTGALITNGGSGYVSTPTVVVTSLDDGLGAALTATMTNGSVTGLTITNGGNGYLNPPSVSFSGGVAARRVFTYDLLNPGWDERTTSVTLAKCQAVSGLDEGSYLAIGQADGVVARVYDPSPTATKPAATYTTRDIGDGAMCVVPGEIKCHLTGTVTANVLSKNSGTTTTGATITLTNGQERFVTTQKPGDTVGLQLNLSSGATIKSGRFTVYPRRK